MMTTSRNNLLKNSITIEEATDICKKELLHPWEVLCGFTDIGFAYVPDIECKEEKDFDEHLDLYMDAEQDVILKANGEIIQVQSDDDRLDELIVNGKYVKLKEKPKYTKG